MIPAGDKNLALILGTYDRAVECRGTFVEWKSCVNVVADMPASTETLVFGPPADPGAQVLLPHFIESGKPSNFAKGSNFTTDDRFGEDDKDCLSRIWYTKKESDTASWFQMWEAITAVYSVCVRNQQRGIIKGLGQ